MIPAEHLHQLLTKLVVELDVPESIESFAAAHSLSLQERATLWRVAAGEAPSLVSTVPDVGECVMIRWEHEDRPLQHVMTERRVQASRWLNEVGYSIDGHVLLGLEQILMGRGVPAR